MDIAYGLLSALGFGVGDFLATVSSRRIGVLRTLLAVQLVGLAALLVTAVVIGDAPPGWSWLWPATALVSLLNFAGIFLLYRSFAIGTLSVVSPVASAYVVLIALLAFLDGERLPGGALAGAVALLFGVVLVARGAGGDTAGGMRGVPEALGAAVCLSTYFFTIGRVATEFGWLWPVVISRGTQLVAVLIVLLILQQAPIAGVSRDLVWPLIGVGIMDTLGMAGFNLGVDRGYTATTAALSSLYAVITVLMAWRLLRERLAAQQWLGVGIILAGVLLVSL